MTQSAAKYRREKVFLSHPSSAEGFARALGNQIESYGGSVFYDLWDVPGDAVPPEIEQALTGCNLFLYALAPAPRPSKWLGGKHQAYLYKKMKESGFRILPLVWRVCPVPPVMGPLRKFDFRRYDPARPPAFEAEKEGPFKEFYEAVLSKLKRPEGDAVPLGRIVYDFYLQPHEKRPKNPDGSWNYKMVFRNLKNEAIPNFAFTIYFKEPVLEVKYDKYHSYAEVASGEGLSADGKRYNWIGDKLPGAGGMILFDVRTKSIPEVVRLSTKFFGKHAGSIRAIPPDPTGL